jgi:sugar lactone lactonase YvrE
MSVLSRRAFLGSVAAAAAAGTATGTASARTVRPDLSRIATVAIHPAIGIARVGNSDDAFFLAPEVPGTVPVGPFKDEAGAMAKQVARFRLYGYDAQGRVVGEITAADAQITWSVIVGNAKAAWYGADEPLDLPDAQPMPLRNATRADRRALAVVSDLAQVQGAGAPPRPLTGGRFLGRRVDLGEILTDADGRLMVMPGSGRAVSSAGAPPLSGFADNDGWTDTTADGPVFATVRIGDRVLKAAPARVVCGSPNYGPGIAAGITTLYDTASSALVVAGRRKRPRTDFFRDVEPIFERMTDMQWVNGGYLTTNGWGSLRDWTTSEWRARLADGSRANAELRQAIFAMFRDPFYGSVQPSLEPQEYGDMVAIPPNRQEPRQWLALAPVQYAHLRSWAEGNFTLNRRADVASIEQAPLQEQPAMLDRAALDGCLGGAFHPGVEFPWIARVPWIWTDDLRLRSAALRPNLGPFGAELTPSMAISRSGPLRSLGPGDVIKWMGVPWQADSSSCRYGYQETVSITLPMFWPARIPNSVLTAEDYDIVVDTSRSLDERRAAFRRRAQWERYISTPNRLDVLSLMVQEWPKLGVVKERPGPSDGAFPKRLKVESRLEFSGPAPDVPVWANRSQYSRFPLVVTNSNDNLLRSIDSTGAVSIVSTSAPLGRPEGIAADAMGNLYVAAMDANMIVRVAPDGTTTPIATGLDTPVGVACDAWGNVYAGGIGGTGWVAKIAPDGKVTNLLVGNPPGIQVHAVAVAPDGALLIAEQNLGRIMRMDPLLGTMLDPYWIPNLNRPKNMAWDSYGNLYVVQRGSNTVTKYDPDGKPLPFTLTGEKLNGPFGIAFDGISTLYVSSANPPANLINAIALQGDQGVVTTFAPGMANPGGVVFQSSLTPVPMT